MTEPSCSDECVPLVAPDGTVIGSARRCDCHGDPTLLHPVVHCVITNRAGDILLQLRAPNKDVEPNKWDTSVGGHVAVGESIEDALRREIQEEIGIDSASIKPRFLYQYIIANALERELVYTYTAICEDAFCGQAEEISELRFWSRDEITEQLAGGIFTPHFVEEFSRFRTITEVASRPVESLRKKT